MNERHKLSVTGLVFGAALIATAVFGRYDIGWSNLARWPWLLGSVLVGSGILLVLGALREDTDVADLGSAAVTTTGIPNVPSEFQEHESFESDNFAE